MIKVLNCYLVNRPSWKLHFTITLVALFLVVHSVSFSVDLKFLLVQLELLVFTL